VVLRLLLVLAATRCRRISLPLAARFVTHLSEQEVAAKYAGTWCRRKFQLKESCCGQTYACKRSWRNGDTVPILRKGYRPDYIAPGSYQRPRRPRLSSWKAYLPDMQVRSCVGTEIRSLWCLEATGRQLPRWCPTKDPADRASLAEKPPMQVQSCSLLRLENNYAYYRLMCVACLCNGLIMTSTCIPRVLGVCERIPRKLKNL